MGVHNRSFGTQRHTKPVSMSQKPSIAGSPEVPGGRERDGTGTWNFVWIFCGEEERMGERLRGASV